MKQDGIAYNAIANFLATMDHNEPREIHLANVLHDCWLYGWNWNTTDALIHAIHDIYDNAEVRSAHG